MVLSILNVSFSQIKDQKLVQNSKNVPTEKNVSGCINNTMYPNNEAEEGKMLNTFDGGFMPLGSLGAPNIFSISLWINPAKIQNEKSIILNAENYDNYNWVVQSLDSGSTWKWDSIKFILTPDKWQHLLLTYENGVRKIFINGKLFKTGFGKIKYSGEPNLLLGNGFSGGGRFNGLVDELYITKDIQYRGNFIPKNYVRDISLKTYGLWHFDEFIFEGFIFYTKEMKTKQKWNLGSWDRATRNADSIMSILNVSN
jgi:hypothetical protein